MVNYFKIMYNKFSNKEFKVKYTVTGHGVAHRTAENYLDDPKVKEFLKESSKF